MIQSQSFLKSSGVNATDLIKSSRVKTGMVEAAEMTSHPLWHTTGLSNDTPLKRPQGCCLDRDASLIYVADTDNDRVIMFDTDGQAVGQFFTSRPIKRPFDMMVGSNGHVYISQLGEKTVDVFDKKGVWQTSIPKVSNEKELKLAPGRMDFDHEGRILLTDRNADVLWIMNVKGKVFEKHYLSRNEADNGLLTGIAVDAQGRIYVTLAHGPSVITVMDSRNTPVFSFGRHGALYEDSFSFPSSVRVDEKGRIWVVDAFRHTIKVFGPNGEYICSIGAYGKEPGYFVYPVDIEIDKKGTLYVLEKGAGRLQAFSIMDIEAE